MLSNSAGFTANSPVCAMRSVYPSGADFCTAVAAMKPLPPGRFSTTKFQPSRSLIFCVRMRVLLRPLARHQDVPRRAEAALQAAAFDERFLRRVEPATSLDGRYFAALGERSEIQAAGHGAAVDEHRAAAAQALPAAFARAEQAECVLQDFD